MKGSILRLNNNAVSNEYTLKKENIGKWYTSERRYCAKQKMFDTSSYDLLRC